MLQISINQYTKIKLWKKIRRSKLCEKRLVNEEIDETNDKYNILQGQQSFPSIERFVHCPR